MNNKVISIRNGAFRLEDRRCKRADCVFPQPKIQFDLDRHIVAAWSWPAVRLVDVPNGVRIQVVPTLMVVPISCN